MPTFGIVDETRYRIVIVEALTPAIAQSKLHAAGYVGRVYSVETLSESTPIIHFRRAAELAKKGRE